MRENRIKRASIDKNNPRPSTNNSQSPPKETDENRPTNNYQTNHTITSQSPSQPLSQFSQKISGSSDDKKTSDSSPKSPSSAKNGKRESNKTKSERKIDFSALTYDFKHFEWPAEVEVPPLVGMSITDQQKALIDDLLYVLVVSNSLTCL